MRAMRYIPAFLAIVMIFTPSHALPCCCTSADEGHAGPAGRAGAERVRSCCTAKPALESKPAKRSCCSGKTAASAARPQGSPGEPGPAHPDAPHGCNGCNSPCCLGQSVASTEVGMGGVDLRLGDGGSALLEPFDLPASLPLDGLLRPPRT